MWVFPLFFPIWTYLDGWETDALVSLVDLVHLFLQHHCLLSQVLQTLWALLGAVVPLPQLKTAHTPSQSELSLVWSCPSSSLKTQHKKMMVPLAKLNTHCTNTVTMQVLQKPGSFWSDHANPPPPLFKIHAAVSKPRWLRIQHERAWPDTHTHIRKIKSARHRWHTARDQTLTVRL